MQIRGIVSHRCGRTIDVLIVCAQIGTLRGRNNVGDFVPARSLVLTRRRGSIDRSDSDTLSITKMNWLHKKKSASYLPYKGKTER